MSDLTLEKTLKRGERGKQVRLVQEWLCLHGVHTSIDGGFGPATERAVKEFQEQQGVKIDGIVGANTFGKFIEPMKAALEPIEADENSPGEMVVKYARQHLQQHPREVGGQNRGPWVRLYMDGNEGNQWAWCAGFVCFILKQACKSLNVPLPFKKTYSCDILAAQAKEKGIFLGEKKIENTSQITPGSIFLNRRTPTDWVHTGIVIEAEEEIFHTIEGNTNDEGSREGYEVCLRIRGYNKKDFVLI
jgi:hypothetical protein